MTPREWAAERKAALLRWEDEYARDVAQAYHGVAIYSRALSGKLPPLHILLAEMHRPSKPHPETLKMQLGQLSEHLGVSFRPISPEAQAALARMKSRG